MNINIRVHDLFPNEELFNSPFVGMIWSQIIPLMFELNKPENDPGNNFKGVDYQRWEFSYYDNRIRIHIFKVDNGRYERLSKIYDFYETWETEFMPFVLFVNKGEIDIECKCGE